MCNFSGNYLNGKRNGEGTEYKNFTNKKCENYSRIEIYSQKITLFSGIYLNGEKKKGKEYNYDGELVYEGEYLNGKRNGKGKLYYSNKKLKYEGDLIDGKKHGKGIEYDKNHTFKYEGEYVNGKKHGYGKEYYLINNNISGEYYLKFEGKYLNNDKFKGKEYYNNGKLKYEGEYLFDKKWNGTMYDCDKNIIYQFNNGEGNGIFEENEGLIKIYIGENSQNYLEEKVKGKEYDHKGRLLFEGIYSSKEKWEGKLKEYLNDELVFEGEYLKGNIWNGFGKMYNSKGNLIFNCKKI